MKIFKKIILSIFITFIFCMNIYAEELFNKETNTEALLLVNVKNNEVLYSKNEKEKLTMASTTKIMNYAVTLDFIEDLEETKIEIKQSSIDKIDLNDSSTAGFQNHVGETFSVLDILKGMMIPSGCEAAQILADYVEETYSVDFVSKMNEKAVSLGMNDTLYVDVHGLSSDNKTTAEDMYKLALYVNDLKYFSEIVKTTSYLIPGFSSKIQNTNYLINDNASGSARKYFYKYAVGTKTGSTSSAGKCLVSRAKKGNDEFIVIALGGNTNNDSNNAMIDTINLYDYAFENYTENIDIIVPKYQSVNINDKLKIEYSITNNNSEKLKWTSLNPDVASVDNDGVVTGLKLGTTKIKVESQTGNYSLINLSVGFYNSMYIDYSYFDYTSGESQNLNWKTLKEDGFDFVVIRNDEFVSSNVDGAKNNNLEYTLSHLATSLNEEDAVKEADEFIESISEYKNNISLPLVYDMYSLSSSRNSYSQMNKEETTNIALAFSNRLKELGFNTIVYNGRTAFNNMDVEKLRDNNIGIYAIYRYSISESEEKLSTKMQTVSGLDVDMWEYTYDEYLKEALSYNSTYLSLMYMGNIIIEESDNGKVNTNINNKKVNINIEPDMGYELESIEVKSKLYNYDLNKENDNLYTYNLKNDYTNTTITSKFISSDYIFISGDNEKYNKNDMVFKINGSTKLIDKILIDEKELSTDNYKINNDEIIIFSSYIDTLNNSEYKITLLLSNNTSVVGKFIKDIEEEVIEEEKEEENNKKSNNNSNVNKDKSSNNKNIVDDSDNNEVIENTPKEEIKDEKESSVDILEGNSKKFSDHNLIIILCSISLLILIILLLKFRRKDNKK